MARRGNRSQRNVARPNGSLSGITIRAFVFVFCGEFAQFAGAFYHSAMNYTTLGYGDVVMTPSWKLFGPLEAADGMLMFGVSTAIIVSVIQLSVRTRFHDLANL